MQRNRIVTCDVAMQEQSKIDTATPAPPGLQCKAQQGESYAMKRRPSDMVK